MLTCFVNIHACYGHVSSSNSLYVINYRITTIVATEMTPHPAEVETKQKMPGEFIQLE
jgi:hypothetical protein